MTLFFFIAAAPTAIVSGFALFVLDRLIKDEIVRRTERVTNEVQRIVQDEQERLKRVVENVSATPEIRELALRIGHEDVMSESIEAIAPRLASAEPG